MLITAYRCPKILRDLLVRAEVKTYLRRHQANGNSLNSIRRCKTCQPIGVTDTFQSTVTGQSFKIRTAATCKIKNLVYLIECGMCSKQYVGETENALHICLNGHRSDVKTKKMEKPVAAHFNLPGHLQSWSLRRYGEKMYIQLRRRESCAAFTTSDLWHQRG